MTRKNSFEYFEFVIEKRFTIKYNANAGVNVGGGFDLYGFGGKSFLDDMNLGVSFGSNRGINGNLSYNPSNPFGNGTVTRNLGLGTTLNFGTNGINGNLSGELSGANVLTYSAGQNMTGNLSFNDSLQYDLAKSKSLRAGEEEYQRKLAEFMQLKENSIRDYYLNQLNNPELYQEYLNADPEKQDQMLKAMEIDKYGKNSKSNANFFTRALSDAKGYFASIAGFGYSDADSFTDSEGEFHQRTCFVAGTLVTVEQNTSGAFEKGRTWFKKIEEIKEGDQVLSWNEKSGVKSFNKVTQLFKHTVKLLFLVSFLNGAQVEATWNHPVYVENKGWTEVKDLRPGDKTITSAGQTLAIASIAQKHVSETDVFNFEVENDHTYFVSEDGVLVHNYGGAEFAVFVAGKLAEWIKDNPELAANIGLDTIKAFLEPPCGPGVSCGTVPGFNIGKAGKVLQKIGSTTDDVVKGGTKVSGEALKQARSEFENVVKPNFWKNQAVNNSDGYSPSNLKRMQEGKPPIGNDGYPMELHHKTPLAEGGSNSSRNLKPLTRTEHRLGENYKKNHPNLP